LQTAGAAAIQMSWADVVPQLASGGIDGVLTSAEGGTNAKFWEHLTHFSAINYSMSLNMTHVNKDAYDALSDDQRAALSTAAQAASDAAWGALATRVSENFAEMEANGITVIKDVPSEFLGLLSTSGESVYSDWLKKVGADGEAILAAYRAQR
jgi:TRAP-type C4-dicarboxylate transport system substrate-binding protein